MIAFAVSSATVSPAAGGFADANIAETSNVTSCVMLTVPANTNGAAVLTVPFAVKEITLFALWRSVPPSSIWRPESRNAAVPDCRMSSVPPEWMVTGTACDEIAFCGAPPLEREVLITTVPPKISMPRSARLSVWLFEIVNVPAPFLTILGYVPFAWSGGISVTFVVSFETTNASAMYTQPPPVTLPPSRR